LVNKTYAVEDIFEDINNDSENVLMRIPPEIAEEMGWNPGDVLKVKIMEGGGISITKVNNGKE
jgi:antitoxin component of MazEF toxin-antitoxin module